MRLGTRQVRPPRMICRLHYAIWVARRFTRWNGAAAWSLPSGRSHIRPR